MLNGTVQMKHTLLQDVCLHYYRCHTNSQSTFLQITVPTNEVRVNEFNFELLLLESRTFDIRIQSTGFYSGETEAFP